MKIKKSQLELLIQKNIKKVLNEDLNIDDDLNQLNKDKVNDEFSDVNNVDDVDDVNDINDVNDEDDEDDYILSPNKNPRFFSGLCEMCGRYYPDLPSNKNGFTQEDLNQIKNIYPRNSLGLDSYFKHVISLDELQYFNHLKKIKSLSFYKCKKLKSVIFPKNFKEIEDDAFNNCTSLKEIKLSNKIKFLGEGCFWLTSLEKVVIPESVEEIENGAFAYCYSLKEIIIPKRFKYYMSGIFYRYKNPDKAFSKMADLSIYNITYI